MKSHWGETVMGLLVLVLAGLFLVYSLKIRDAGSSGSGYELTAKFGDAGALAPGDKVVISGVKVGSVETIALDPKTYLAVAHLTVDGTVKLPSDSTAKITSDGLLGGAHIALTPGGAADDLKNGDEIANTQGAVDLFGLIGQFIRPHGDSTPGVGASASAPAASKPAPSASSAPGTYPAGMD